MNKIVLTLRGKLSISIEADCITPDNFCMKTLDEISNLPVYAGRHAKRLGDFFYVKGNAAHSCEKQAIELAPGCDKVNWIGRNMSAGSINILGNCGMHLAEGMLGGEIHVQGDCVDWAATDLRGGKILIEGSAGNFLASAFWGASGGMRGGEVIVLKNCGDFAGKKMLGGKINVGGRAGRFPGYGMLGGTMDLVGCENYVGALMKSGVILLQEKPELLPGFLAQETCEYAGSIAYAGDLVCKGSGRIIVPEVRK